MPGMGFYCRPDEVQGQLESEAPLSQSFDPLRDFFRQVQLEEIAENLQLSQLLLQVQEDACEHVLQGKPLVGYVLTVADKTSALAVVKLGEPAMTDAGWLLHFDTHRYVVDDQYGPHACRAVATGMGKLRSNLLASMIEVGCCGFGPYKQDDKGGAWRVTRHLYTAVEEVGLPDEPAEDSQPSGGLQPEDSAQPGPAAGVATAMPQDFGLPGQPAGTPAQEGAAADFAINADANTPAHMQGCVACLLAKPECKGLDWGRRRMCRICYNQAKGQSVSLTVPDAELRMAVAEQSLTRRAQHLLEEAFVVLQRQRRKQLCPTGKRITLEHWQLKRGTARYGLALAGQMLRAVQALKLNERLFPALATWRGQLQVVMKELGI